MDAVSRQQYLADDPPTIVPLVIKPHFEALNDKEKTYAHYISKACFAGTRVVLRSVSPESESIYDFVIALHKSCGGELESDIAQASGHSLTLQATTRSSNPRQVSLTRISSTI